MTVLRVVGRVVKEDDRYEKFKKFSDRKYRGILDTMLPLEKGRNTKV